MSEEVFVALLLTGAEVFFPFVPLHVFCLAAKHTVFGLSIGRLVLPGESLEEAIVQLCAGLQAAVSQFSPLGIRHWRRIVAGLTAPCIAHLNAAQQFCNLSELVLCLLTEAQRTESAHSVIHFRQVAKQIYAAETSASSSCEASSLELASHCLLPQS